MRIYFHKAIALITLLAAIACGGTRTTSEPTSLPVPTSANADQPAVVAPQPVFVETPQNEGYEITFYPNAGFDVENTSGSVQTYYAYITSFDDQRTAQQVRVGLNVKDKALFSGSFNTTCVQLDITQESTVAGGVGGRPLEGAYIYVDAKGKLHKNPAELDRAACNPTPTPRCTEGCEPTPQPTPTPTPSPSPTPTPSPSPTPTPSPSPTPTPSPSPTPTPTPSPTPSPTPTPAPGACYYRVSCGVSFNTNSHNSCTDQNQQFICEHTFAVTQQGFVFGIWRNFGEQSLQNHCQFPLPGVSLLNFQLNPGQSSNSCLSKHDQN